MEYLPRHAAKANMDIICVINIQYTSQQGQRQISCVLTINLGRSGEIFLLSQVLRRLRRRSFRGDICLGETTINNKVRGINKAALVASQKYNRMSLFNGFPKPTGREVNLPTKALLLVIAEPILQEGRVKRCRT